MKRDEALKVLKMAIDTYLEGQGDDINSDELAEIVLTHCESMVGMVPPPIRTKVIPHGVEAFAWIENKYKWED
jgi:hypothetical protein